MKVKPAHQLLILDILVVFLILIIVFFPSTILRIIIGIPFVLFFPGYVLMLALFPAKQAISDVERLALSLGLSLAVVPLLGLLLNYLPWGIRLEAILYSLSFFILVMSAVAWFRQRRLTAGERFCLQFSWGRLSLWGSGALNRTLSIVLILVILGALGMLGYTLSVPKQEQKFTEFYILGPGGDATHYPKELKLGEKGTVIVGVVNHEFERVTYRVEVRIGGITNNEMAPFSLEPEEKWEQPVDFSPQAVGQNQDVEFLLYKNGELAPDLKPLRLWIDVVE
jgi:uncharacterized membrane protein